MADLPAPLTNPTCNLTDFPFMPLDVARLRDSDLATLEPPDVCWAAVLLWCTSWHQVPAASIPDDDRWIADKAGYVSRGRIDSQWKKVRAGALRGWIKCADGRLYHPVVAEKARDAWIGKLKNRWKSECERVRKHNQRNDQKLVAPSFDEFLSQLPADDVPQDIRPMSCGTAEHVQQDDPTESGGRPAQNRSIGIGDRGQGQGQGTVLKPRQSLPHDDDGTPNSARPPAAGAVPVRDWGYSPSVELDLANLYAIPIEFADQQQAEFRHWWADKPPLSPNEWDAKFLQRVVDQWEREQQRRGIA